MNKQIYRIISIVVALALAFGGFYEAQASSANPYYVSVTGNDSNAGTLASPFQTISKAMSVAQAGDVIYVRAGTYSAFSVSKSGIMIAGYNDEMPIISGGKGIECSSKSDITIKGFEVTGASGNYIGAITLNNCNNVIVMGNKIHDNNATSVSGIVVLGSNNKVLNNEIYNNNFSGVRLYGASLNNEVGFNRIHNQTLSSGNSDGIGIADSSVTKTNIHDNTVFGNSDDGIDTWASAGNIVVNNVSYGNGGTGDGNGFKMGGSSTGGNNTVVGNVSYSNNACGFTSNGGGNYYESNTSYNNGMCGFGDSWRNTGNTQTSSFINNLAYNNPDGNFKTNPAYTAVFVGNSENSKITPAASPAPSSTNIAPPVITPTVMSSLTPTSVMPTVIVTTTPAPALPTATETASMPTVVVTASPTAAASPKPVEPASTPTIIPPAPQSVSEVIYDEKDSAFVYSGSWKTVVQTQAYKGSFKLTTERDSFVTLPFTGQSFSILYSGGSAYKKMNVYVDGVLVAAINERTTKSSFQRRWNYAGQLAPGAHTLKLVFVAPAKLNNVSGSIDAVIVR